MRSNLKFFSWGILAAAGALVLEVLLSVLLPSVVNPALEARWSVTLVILVLVEELLIFLFVWKMAAQTAEKKAIFSRALLIGLGFPAPEIIENAALYPYISSFFLSVYLGLLLVHTVTALIYGYAFMFYGTSLKKTWPAWVVGIAVHLLFNLAVIFGTSYWALDGIFLVLGLFLWLRHRKAKVLPK